jgi:hypothetical protein
MESLSFPFWYGMSLKEFLLKFQCKKQIDKNKEVRNSRWNVLPLNHFQKLYAAIDVYVSPQPKSLAKISTIFLKFPGVKIQNLGLCSHQLMTCQKRKFTKHCIMTT